MRWRHNEYSGFQRANAWILHRNPGRQSTRPRLRGGGGLGRFGRLGFLGFLGFLIIVRLGRLIRRGVGTAAAGAVGIVVGKAHAAAVTTFHCLASR